MCAAVVDERMRGIEPQAVEPILAQPVNGVVDDEAADSAPRPTIELTRRPTACDADR
jgi:hypothetical protein